MRKIDSGHFFYGKRYIIISTIIALLAAFVINVFIQYRLDVLSFIWTYPWLFSYTSLMLFFCIVLFSSLIGNVYSGSVAVAGIMIVMTFADRVKYAVRGEHVYPDDIAVTSNLGAYSGMYDHAELARQIILIIVLAAFANVMLFLILRARKRAGMYEKPGWSRRKLLSRIAVRIGIAACAFGMVVLMALPLMEQNNQFAAKLGFYYYKSSQDTNYSLNGFIAAFISNMGLISMDAPEGYSAEAVQAIVDKYKAQAAQDNTQREQLSAEDVDVIFILNESFCDPSKFADLVPYSGGDVTPNLHELEKTVTTGPLRTVQFGGGTANVEFEGLTGFSLYFAGESTVAYQEFFTGRSSFPSLADVLKESGNYGAIGMHPYDPTMFKRSTVYPRLGYDAFLSEKDFKHTATYDGAYYISDASAYDEVFDKLDAEAPGSNMFITLITMQNHGSYGSQIKDHPFTVDSPSIKPEDAVQIEDYMALLNGSDKALGDLASRVAARDKKTLVVFFGDHLPGVYSNYISNDDDRKFQTPLLIMSNFDPPSPETGMVSINYLSSIMLDYMNVKKPPYYYLLDDVRQQVPILTRNYFYTRPAPEVNGAFADYQMIEYDTVAGKKYAEADGFFSLDK